MTWIELRKRSGISQFSCAKSSGVSRVRLSLAENGHVTLKPEEETAVIRAINDHLKNKTREFGALASSTSATA